ncbi:MAG: AAA family ATPase [Methanobacteriota archaeon]
MEASRILTSLCDPKFYDVPVSKVRVIQTHISFVALTGSYAYKVKKPVNFGFLDFSTLEKRKYFCEEELRLNRRLCPDVYLDVLPVTSEDDTLRLNGKGTVVDYALKMNEFPQENIMTNLLQKGRITEETIEHICSILVDFYAKEKRSPEIDEYGKLAAVKQNIDENFKQTTSVVDVTIPNKTYQFLKDANAEYFKKKSEVFDQRIREERIHDCHGDLHSGNIVVSGKKIFIFDCIEFNKRFRFCDVASDIGFLAMDLDYQNQPYLSSYLINCYREKSGDTSLFTVLNFYKSYRAYVRGKVLGFQLSDPHVESARKQEIVSTAGKYFALSEYYARLFSLDVSHPKSLLFVVSGLTGTGKSTVAAKIAVDYHACQINTDVVRKQRAGVDVFERHHDQFNTGLYDPRNVDATYTSVIEEARKRLVKGENVVLDATFQKQKYRELARMLAQDTGSMLILVYCRCPDAVVKHRLLERVKKKSISDGRWEIYLRQKETFESFTKKENALEMDTSQTSSEYRQGFFISLLNKVQGM